ncbi:MAG: hypothetical protein NUV63_01490 [Gallionella sp.]|nr:hypothetical protein [Gallionella sp.]
MKYILAGLIIPTIQILFIVVFAIGALYFGVGNLLERTRKLSPEYTAAKQRSLLHDARAFPR